MSESCLCSRPAVRLLGTVAYCGDCADRLLDPIRERVGVPHQFAGVATRCGAAAPAFGPSAYGAACDRCGATWVALVEREACRWCTARYRRVVAEQVELVLRPPDIDPASAGHAAAMKAWANRMLRAVAVGIITAEHADNAWRREVAVNVAA